MGDEVHRHFRPGIIGSDFCPVFMGQDVQGANCGEDCQLFTVVAMVLQRKPDVLIIILPTLRETSKYQGQDNLPVIVWMIVQASEGDLALALYASAHNLFKEEWCYLDQEVDISYLTVSNYWKRLLDHIEEKNLWMWRQTIKR